MYWTLSIEMCMIHTFQQSALFPFFIILKDLSYLGRWSTEGTYMVPKPHIHSGLLLAIQKFSIS